MPDVLSRAVAAVENLRRCKDRANRVARFFSDARRAGRVAFGNFRVGEIPLSIVRTGDLLTVFHFGIFPKEQSASYRMCRQDGCGSATIVA